MFDSSPNSVEKLERAFSSTKGMSYFKIAAQKIEGFVVTYKIKVLSLFTFSRELSCAGRKGSALSIVADNAKSR